MKAGRYMALAALMAGWLPALGASLWIASCADTSAAAGPTGPEAALVGEWVANYPTLQGFTVSMRLNADKSYLTATTAAGKPFQRESGKWTLRASRVVFSPGMCEAMDQASERLYLVACTGADSIAVNVTAGTWPVTFTADDGRILQLTFRRL